MKQLRAWVLNTWKPLLIAMAIVLLCGLFLGFRIGSLTHGVSLPEKQYIDGVNSGRQILNEPVYLVHKLPVYVLFKMHIKHAGAYRAVSALFATAMVLSGVFVLKRWYSLRVAVIGGWLMLTAATTLHIARLAIPEATFMLLLPMLAMAVWMRSTQRHNWALVVLSFMTGISLYIPGFFWLIVAFWVWQRKVFWQAIKKMPGGFQVVCGLILIFSILLLALSSIQRPQNLLLAAGFPTHIPSVVQIGKNAVAIPEHFFARGADDAVRNLGRLPLLDVFSTVMFVLGIYSLRFYLSHFRARLLLGSALVLVILIIAGGLPISVLLPIVYLVVAGGIGFILQQWFTVFPRNPIAHIIATTLVSTTVLLTSFYNINHYFIAWPQTPATRQVFNQSLVK